MVRVRVKKPETLSLAQPGLVTVYPWAECFKTSISVPIKQGN